MSGKKAQCDMKHAVLLLLRNLGSPSMPIFQHVIMILGLIGDAHGKVTLIGAKLERADTLRTRIRGMPRCEVEVVSRGSRSGSWSSPWRAASNSQMCLSWSKTHVAACSDG